MALKEQDSVRYLKGVGDKRALLYQKLGVFTVGDLLRHYPRSYIDFSRPCEIAGAPFGEVCAVVATVLSKGREQRLRKGIRLFKVRVSDGTASLILTFFNAKYAVDALQAGESYLFYGKIGGTLTHREMSSPSVFPCDPAHPLQAVYPLTAGLSAKVLSANIQQALQSMLPLLTDPLPVSLQKTLKLCPLPFALENIHRPSSAQALQQAKRRLILEELLTLSLAMAQLRAGKKGTAAAPFSPVPLDPFYASLPFAPTGAQRRAILECEADLARGTAMNRIIQGDVGSGKTLVAAGCVYLAAKNKYQAAMMAPTEILAEQHYRTLCSLLQPMGLRIGLLTGSLRASEKKRCLSLLHCGQIDLLVGTHALLQEGVVFHRLGLVVTDEQHRFGVGQRMQLAQKGQNPHVLVMSATPIPRTLAFMIYGDLEASVLDELPCGRQPVKTYLIDPPKRKRAFGFIRRLLEEGRQGYIICPLVEQGEGGSGLESATEYAARLKREDFSAYRIGLLHGRMKAAEKERVMRAFQSGQIQLLVSTTVVEVGVDVPNATVMLIENAERFGLSQLHQLRGRVGRGPGESHCILIAAQDTQRLSVIRDTTDGFRISEEDLKLRGPGDFFGSRQHGLPQLKIADMTSDLGLLEQAQQAASLLLKEDPTLCRPEYAQLRAQVEHMIAGAAI